MTTVVNCRHDAYDVYCGRPSIWALAKYRAYLELHPEIVERAKAELTGKRIGCHCKPKACHLDILVEFMERE